MTFPDAEALLIQWLAARVSAWVCTDLPAELEQHLPVLQVTRIGGAGAHKPFTAGGHLLDGPTCDLDAFAGTREDAADLCRRACGLLGELRGDVTADGGVVVDVTENVGPSWRPDYNPRVRRFGATYQFLIRPA